jgi:hypothetical protein
MTGRASRYAPIGSGFVSSYLLYLPNYQNFGLFSAAGDKFYGNLEAQFWSWLDTCWFVS